MRFRRYIDHAFEDTRLKRLALERRQRREREALPLLAEIVAEDQPDADTVMAARADAWDQNTRRARQRRATAWREARSRLSSLSHNERSVLRDAWNRAPYPADPVYLLDFLHGYAVGRFTLDRIPFAPPPGGYRYDAT